MSNMSYCRFENTASDLNDCRDALESLLAGGEDEDGEISCLSGRELEAACNLAITCARILEMLSADACREEVDMTDDDLVGVLRDANDSAEQAEQTRRHEEEAAEEK